MWEWAPFFLGNFWEIFWIIFFWIRRNFSCSDVRAFLGFFWDFLWNFKAPNFRNFLGIFVRIFWTSREFSGNFLGNLFPRIFLGFPWDFPWKQSGFWKGKVRFPAKE